MSTRPNMENYEKMLKKLPVAFGLIYMYNFCYSKPCSSCKFMQKRFGGGRCCVSPIKLIKLYQDFCDSNLTCESCNLEKNFNCVAQYSIKKLIACKENEERK